MAKKHTDYKGQNEADLKEALLKKKESLRKFRFESSGGKVKNVREARNIRKEIARILTEMRKGVEAK